MAGVFCAVAWWSATAAATLETDGTGAWEGEAAARFEALAAQCTDVVSPWPEIDLPLGAAELPSVALLVAAAGRLRDGEVPSRVAAGFHATFCRLAATLVTRVCGTQVRTVAVGGGCLINRLLRCGLEQELAAAGFEPLFARDVPPGDGGLAYGQAVLAAVSLGNWMRPLGGKATSRAPAVAKTSRLRCRSMSSPNIGSGTNVPPAVSGVVPRALVRNAD